MIGVWKEATNRDIKSPLSDTKSFDFRKPLEKFEAEITVKDNTEFDPRKPLDINEKISNYTTYRVGGKVRAVCFPNTEDDLITLVNAIIRSNQKMIILNQ